MSLSIAIVGSGPAGFYCAEALARRAPGAAIDIIDRLPTPFGLVRAGVAPDHQSTKAITRVFDRTAGKPGVRFLGNVCLGRDITLAELGALYDAVVLAFGAPDDRRLGVPGEDLDNVFGSAAFVGWYNGHPDHCDLPVRLSDVRSVAVVGNGNVAIDVARVLAKTPAEMAKSDIAAHAATAIRAAPIAEINVIGRRGPLEASFTNAELAELGRLERCVPLVDAAVLPDSADAVEGSDRKVKQANLATLAAFAGNRPGDKPLRLRFHFHAAPTAILGEQSVRGIQLGRTRGTSPEPPGLDPTFEIAADLVVTCIGYRVVAPDGVPCDAAQGIVANREGEVADGLYVVGWARRGPSGTIATNRADAMAVAERLLGRTSAASRPGPTGLDAALAARGTRVVHFADWQRIDAAECARGGSAPRAKFHRVAEMLKLLD